jgi:Fe2+ transport system protein FeoA
VSEETTILSDLAPGTKAKIVKINGDGETRRRIVDMGMTPGTLIEVERIAPLGDPMEVKVKGYHLSLRLVEAGTVAVEPL